MSTTDRKGKTTTFTYDALNRRAQSTFADGAIALFQYDAAGRLVKADDTADPHRPIGLEYDPLDRLLAETTSLGTVSYAYDALGRRTEMTVSGQAPVTYAYDTASRLRTITQTPLNPVTIDYDAAGRRTLLTLPNGVSTEYQYDAASRLTTLMYRNALGLLGDLTYQYDPASNRTGVGGSFARTLLPDPVSMATYDAANRQLTLGAKSMTYDPNGNLLSMAEGPGTTTFTWDPRNRLTAVSGPSATGTFAYDAAGRRAQKTIDGHTSAFQYDGADIVREEANGAEVRYLRTLAVDEPLLRSDSTRTAYYLADQLGSIVGLANETGTPATAYNYEPFGRSRATGTVGANPFQFTARETDLEALFYFRARYYSPALGRFISEDPLGLRGRDVNFYAYVSNSPASGIDPLGLWRFADHRRDTYEALRSEGFSEKDSRAAALANALMDLAHPKSWGDCCDPRHYMPGTDKQAEAFIRDRFEEALRRERAGDRAGAMEALGQGLHTVQDEWAHAHQKPPGTIERHRMPTNPDDPNSGAEWTDPDNPLSHPYEWERARKCTRNYIRDFKRGRPLKPRC